MSLAELMPSVTTLPRHEKYRLAQNLLAELAQQDKIDMGEYAVFTPEFSPGVEKIMRDLLEQDKMANQFVK